MPKKRKDGRYAKQITIGHKDGKAVKKTVYGKTLKELESNYTNIKNMIEKGTRIDLENITVGVLMDEWYNTRIFPNVNPNTQKRYYYFFNAVKPLIGDLKVTEVKRFHIESMVASFRTNGGASMHERLILTKKFFSYATECDIIYKNPCDGINIRYEPKQKRLLTKDELDKISNCDLTRRDKAFLYILRYTGMRIGEVLALGKSDIDRNNLTILINKTIISAKCPTYIQENTKTRSSDRIIPIFLPLIKPLFLFIDNLPETQEQLFLSNVGSLYTTTAGSHLFKRILRNCGIFDNELSPHYMRHNFISECYKAGIDIKKVQTWVGHSNIQTTLNIYTHLEKDFVKDGTDMDDFYDSQKTVISNSKNSELHCI